ncbi:MAG TPA: M28 family peptidase, partial [Kofleriaceae bacterium]
KNTELEIVSFSKDGVSQLMVRQGNVFVTGMAGAAVGAVTTKGRTFLVVRHDAQLATLELPTAPLEAEYRASATAVGATVVVTTTQGTDHQAFREKGFPAIGLTEEYVANDTSPYRHTAQDTASTVKQSYLQLGTKLVAHVIMNEL